MDSLLAEINSKRKALTELDGGGEPSKKYMRRADIERAKEEEDARKRAEAKAAEEAKSESSRAAKMRREVRSRPYRLKWSQDVCADADARVGRVGAKGITTTSRLALVFFEHGHTRAEWIWCRRDIQHIQ